MKKIILACTISIMYCAAYGQVTIGAEEEPVNGALLQLKNIEAVSGGGVNATKGLGLPRVKLVNLKPGAATGANSLPLSIGSPQAESWDLNAHIGLTVYNINPCPAGRTIIYDETGPQVWDGSRWQPFIRPVIVEAGPEATSGANRWGRSVVRHAAKPNPDYVSETATPGEPENIYEDFYSADFGTAGRWMTTNLAAWKYDGNTHSQGYSLTLSITHNYSQPYWCYPGNNSGTVNLGGTNPMAFMNNPFLGLLYNWSAATAGKGGDTGQKNIYNLTSGNTAANNESAREYDSAQLDGTQASFPGNGTSGYQWRIQGVCPQGWHLPSDYEWLLLEKEIIRRTTDYSSSTANINPSETNNRNEAGDQIQIPAAGNNGTTGNRVSGLGTALKDACGINNVIPNGTSNEIASGGFNILLAGTLFNNVSGFGGAAAAWTSSSYSTNPSSDSSWFRSLSSGSNNLVYRYTALRVAMYSVRCVKD